MRFASNNDKIVVSREQFKKLDPDTRISALLLKRQGLLEITERKSEETA